MANNKLELTFAAELIELNADDDRYRSYPAVLASDEPVQASLILPAACAVALKLPGLVGMESSKVTVTVLDAGPVPYWSVAVAWIWLLPLARVSEAEKRPSAPVVIELPTVSALLNNCTVLLACAVPETVTLAVRTLVPLAGWLSTGAGGGAWATVMSKLWVVTFPSESVAFQARVCGPFATLSILSVAV